MKLLLDTNAYSAFKRGHSEVAALMRRAQRVVMSAVVAGELMYGFHHGRRLRENRRELEEFLSRTRVDFMPVSFVTADRFGRLASALRTAGTPVPVNDVWIAAHTLESGGELVSFDSHFDRFPGLPWIHLEA